VVVQDIWVAVVVQVVCDALLLQLAVVVLCHLL
jgi:hypothetical protein